MFPSNLRDQAWSRLSEPWDLLVIGGGITGAGILREATRIGLRALLVEQRDFAWGTSSRSSKLVHGGLRYLKEGRLGLTLASVQERQRLLEEGPGLIDPLGFLLATYEGDSPGRHAYRAGLSVYDLLALQWTHRFYSAADFQMLAPHISRRGLQGGFAYGDAQTDDARLVLRVIREAARAGGLALNYARVDELLRDGATQQVTGVVLHDVTAPAGRTAEVRARVVVNATGAWAGRLQRTAGPSLPLRPLRGSHLVFPADRLPVAQAHSFLHPIDGRPVFVVPWEGAALVGTTDVDHREALDDEPRISPEEVSYLMAAVDVQYPSLGLTLDDVVSTFAGVRPVLGSGKADPSQESRDHIIREDAGLVTVTGGKLTTFRRVALAVLEAARARLPDMPDPDRRTPVLDPVDASWAGGDGLGAPLRRRLLGRYGAEAPLVVGAARPGELACLPGSQTLWAELRWAARSEAVVHLDDLLLRRTRLGLLQPEGGAALLPALRGICQEELGWDDGRWAEEADNYRATWRRCYSLPERADIPDWRNRVAQAVVARAERRRHQRERARRAAALGALAGVSVVGAAALWRRSRRGRG
jgi:glycerol-3-phosphate dehydrogenase